MLLFSTQARVSDRVMKVVGTLTRIRSSEARLDLIYFPTSISSIAAAMLIGICVRLVGVERSLHLK